MFLLSTGVGFYSAFMVGDKVDVRSLPAMASEDDTPHLWSSDGTGSFDISKLQSSIRQDRGTSIVIHLKDDAAKYCDEKEIEKVLKKYSNFVNFPIFLNGNRINTMQAIWALGEFSFYKYWKTSFLFIQHVLNKPPIFVIEL